jgi:antirestriction protein ArdC
LVLLSAPRERANTNFKKEDKMKTSTINHNTHKGEASRQDIYTRVTERIVADLEQGVRPWAKPWNAEHAAGKITRPLRHNGTPYSGINILMLWSSALAGGFAAPIWMTFRQSMELGGHVRKGEKGSLVVYANSIMRKETNEQTGDDTEREIHFMKGYTVFNVEQIEGLPAHYYAKPEPRFNPIQRIEHAEQFFTAIKADIRHGGTQAYYAQASDYIRMPPFEAFCDAESYYATLAHESTHWTKHPSRLDREFGRKKWGDEGYAEEELVAELGAAFLCADLELALQPREDHASYIAHWLNVLQNDKRAIFRAAAHAQRAADHLHGLQHSPQAIRQILS